MPDPLPSSHVHFLSQPQKQVYLSSWWTQTKDLFPLLLLCFLFFPTQAYWQNCFCTAHLFPPPFLLSTSPPIIFCPVFLKSLFPFWPSLSFIKLSKSCLGNTFIWIKWFCFVFCHIACLVIIVPKDKLGQSVELEYPSAVLLSPFF